MFLAVCRRCTSWKTRVVAPDMFGLTSRVGAHISCYGKLVWIFSGSVGPFLVSQGQQHMPVSRVSVRDVFLRTLWAGSVGPYTHCIATGTKLLISSVRISSSPAALPFFRCLTSFAFRWLWNHHQSHGFLGRIVSTVWSYSVAVWLVGT